jgi:hypothetical protein
MDSITLIGTVVVIITSSSGVFLFYYKKIKNKLSAIRNALDELDNALKDDHVTEEEFIEIFKRFKLIVYA